MSLLQENYKKLNFSHHGEEMKAALRQQAINQFWDRGILRYKCFPGGQTKLYDRVHQQPKLFPGEAEPIIALCHRRFGKSHFGGILCVERCLNQPGAEVHFGTDTKNHARQIIEGKLFETFKDMPRFISYRTRDNCYWFRNEHWPRGVESMLVLEGLDFKDGGQMRGGSADLFVVDEPREIRNLEFVMKRVVRPMFKGRKNPTILMCTTPPESLDHDLMEYIEIAESTKPTSLITIPASKNPDWTDDDTKLMLNDYVSKNDMGWRREIECELIPDTTRVIVPEWEIVKNNCIIETADRPIHYAPYVVVDTGWKDHTAALLAYYDFNRNKVVIVDELFVNYTPTEDFAEMLHEKIQTNFRGKSRDNLRLIGDGNGLNLADLNRAMQKLGEYYVAVADKTDRDASINNMRSGIQSNRVLIQKNCTDTCYQLLNGSWNKQRTNFDRTKKMGHCDLVACLSYLYKHICWGENTTPAGTEGWKEGVFQNPYSPLVQARQGEMTEAIEAIFGKKRFINRRRTW